MFKSLVKYTGAVRQQQPCSVAGGIVVADPPVGPRGPEIAPRAAVRADARADAREDVRADRIDRRAHRCQGNWACDWRNRRSWIGHCQSGE